jgi:hypothetical protein
MVEQSAGAHDSRRRVSDSYAFGGAAETDPKRLRSLGEVGLELGCQEDKSIDNSYEAASCQAPFLVIGYMS